MVLYSSGDLGVAGDGDRIGKVVSIKGWLKRDENEGVQVPRGSSVVSICRLVENSDKKKKERKDQ